MKIHMTAINAGGGPAGAGVIENMTVMKVIMTSISNMNIPPCAKCAIPRFLLCCSGVVKIFTPSE